MQDAAMELLINTLAEMKKQDIKNQLEEQLIGSYMKQKEASAASFFSKSQTIENQTRTQLKVEESMQDDFDTTLTNDYDSTINEMMSQSMSKKAPQGACTGTSQSVRQAPQNSKKFRNFLERSRPIDEVEVENVKVVPSCESQEAAPAKKYVFKRQQVATQETEETPEKNAQSKHYKIRRPDTDDVGVQPSPQRVYKFKEPRLMRHQDSQTRERKKGRHHHKPQQSKSIIQIVQMPARQPSGKQPKPSSPRRRPSRATAVSPMVIKEQIIQRGSVQQNKRKRDTAIDIAAAVAAEYEKQLRKLQEEEGNKTVPEQELRELSMMVNAQPPPRPPPPPRAEEESSGTSVGEIWPAYDQKTAGRLQEKGRGIGVWDRSVSERWDLGDDASEGEVYVFREIDQSGL